MRDAIVNHRDALCRIVCRDIGSVGTGFFVAENLIVTCDHVVSRETLTADGLIAREYSSSIEVETLGRRFKALVANDVNSTAPYFYDYAVLKVPQANPEFLRLSEYDAVSPGDDLLILGFPLGSEHLVATRGMVAAKATIPSHQNRIATLDIIEIDGSINVGQSGGPAILLLSGAVAGIVSVRYGSMADSIDAFRSGFGSNMPGWLTELLEVLEVGNTFLNPGLGYAVSTRYVREALTSLGR